MEEQKSKKDVLTEKYVELTNEIMDILDMDIFPSVEDVNITDIAYFLTNHFTVEENYDTEVKFLMAMKWMTVTDDDFEIIMKIVTPFINWLKQL